MELDGSAADPEAEEGQPHRGRQAETEEAAYEGLQAAGEDVGEEAVPDIHDDGQTDDDGLDVASVFLGDTRVDPDGCGRRQHLGEAQGTQVLVGHSYPHHGHSDASKGNS